MHQVSQQSFWDGIQKMNMDYPVFIPEKAEESTNFKFIEKNNWKPEDAYISPIRTAQPLKSFFYPPYEKVAVYFGQNDANSVMQPAVIIGAKACDLLALQIIDKVYAEGATPDPAYVKARQENIIISTDCTEAGPYCYCTLMNCQPYPEKAFDLNITPIEQMFLLEIGSEKGQMLLEKYFGNLQDAPEEMLKERTQLRESVVADVKRINENFQFFETHQNAIEKHLDTDVWADLAKTCVECGICTQICPTCHCFLLYDQETAERFERIKVWDSCFFGGYSRMAGGLTPRLRLADRFKNRFYHKFDSFVTNFSIEACTGCGRCVEGCMGKIDLREVLLELEKRVVLKEKLDIS